jgi:light-regulated signal transduction histidine kinase (bacteriophytochrome)
MAPVCQGSRLLFFDCLLSLVDPARDISMTMTALHITKDNLIVDTEFNASWLFDDQGQTSGVQGSSRDIRERKKAEAEIRKLNEELEQRVKERTVQLEAANKELEAFAYSVSHDLRAPLRAMGGFSEILQTDYSARLDDQGKHYLERIQAASDRMGELINDLLTMSRVTRAEFNKQQVDLSKLATEIFATLQETEPQRKARFEIIPGLFARGDVHLLRIAMENMLGNAWKFSANNNETHIEVGRTVIEGDEVFYIRDNGAGFDMAYADKLFGAFQRLHRAEEFPGTGIGLATVQRIINRHGGKVWAESEMGKGSTFYFTLPH